MKFYSEYAECENSFFAFRSWSNCLKEITVSQTFKGIEEYRVKIAAMSLNEVLIVLKILSGIDTDITSSNADADKNQKIELKDATSFGLKVF